jgi:hypothetical protein
MKLVAFTCVVAGLLSPAVTAAAERPRLREGQAFKGVEMYTWKPEGEDWRFSLLPGTNRMKTEAERTDPKVTIVGLPAVKRRLESLAIGEVLFWGWREGQKPPAEMIDEIRRHCRELEIRLNMP